MNKRTNNDFEFKGSPVYTIVDGHIKMSHGKILGDPKGKPLLFKE